MALLKGFAGWLVGAFAGEIAWLTIREKFWHETPTYRRLIGRPDYIIRHVRNDFKGDSNNEILECYRRTEHPAEQISWAQTISMRDLEKPYYQIWDSEYTDAVSMARKLAHISRAKEENAKYIDGNKN